MRNKRQEYFDRLLSLTTDYDETIEEDGVFSDRREDFILSPIKMFLKSHQMKVLYKAFEVYVLFRLQSKKNLIPFLNKENIFVYY